MPTFSVARNDTSGPQTLLPDIVVKECTLAYSDWTDGTAKTITAENVEGYKTVLVRTKSSINKSCVITCTPGVYFGTSQGTAVSFTSPAATTWTMATGTVTPKVYERMAKPVLQDLVSDYLGSPDTLAFTVAPTGQPTVSGSVIVQLLCR